MTSQYCTFRLAGHLCGIPVEYVQEVLRVSAITPVPLSPSAVTGLINLRGLVITTIDLRTRLGLDRTVADEDSVSVVVRGGDGVPVNLLVDRVEDVLHADDAWFEPPPPTLPDALRSLVVEVCKLEGELMLLLDAEQAISIDRGAA